MSDPTLSDNDFKNKIGSIWTILYQYGMASVFLSSGLVCYGPNRMGLGFLIHKKG